MVRNIIIKNEHVLSATLNTSNPEEIYNLSNVLIKIDYNELNNQLIFKMNYQINLDNIIEKDYCCFKVTFHNDPNFKLENDTLTFDMFNNINDANNQIYFTYLNKYHGILKFKFTVSAIYRIINYAIKHVVI